MGLLCAQKGWLYIRILQRLSSKSEGFSVSLKYTDDTLFIDRGSLCGEFLVMKAILWWFELMLGLKVNFSKNRLGGVNFSKKKKARWCECG
jgi:hypothetical protein